MSAFGMALRLADRDVTVEACDAAGALLDTALVVSPPGTGQWYSLAL